MAKKETVDKRNPQNDKYIEAYINNEISANKSMAKGNALAGLVMFVIWILYIFKIFPVGDSTYLLVNIVFPIDIVILITPLIYVHYKSHRVRNNGFKYFVVFSFLLVISVLNIIVPKHGIIGWALCLVITNHYYNPKLGRAVFIATLISMLLCMYLGMFVGEYDPNLLGKGIVTIKDGKEYIYFPPTSLERFEMLNDMLKEGENRYLKVFLYYYLSRAALLSLIFILSNSLNKRTYKLLIDEIKVNTEQQTIATELNVSKNIQIATLPDEFVANQDVEILGELKAAKDIGGDFYDYIALDDDHVAFIIADVSGKGIPAAMFMMKTITCFKNFASVDKTPSKILNEINKAIYEGNKSQMFVTCFIGILNTKTGVLKFSNAGHNPPIVGENFHFHYLKCSNGFILGGMPEAYVKDEEYTFKHGESITLYTDGYTEARNDKGEFYGEERLIHFFNTRDFTCILQMHHDLKDDVSLFVNGYEQSDDMTILTIKYHGDKYVFKDKLFPAKKEKIQEMLSFISNFVDEQKIEPSFKNNLLVVGDELVSNIVNYAYQDEEGEVYIRILFNLDKRELIFTLIDKGIPFNPLEVNSNPLEGKAEDQRIGGLGILIVKNIMSESTYDRIYDKNIITLRKKL